MISVRKLLGKEETDYDKLAEDTVIIHTVKEVINMLLVDQTHPELVCVAYYMKLELTWILANLVYANDKVCLELLTQGPLDDFGQR